MVEGTRSEIHSSVLYLLNVECDPLTYRDAIASHDSAFWKEAINDEMESIMENNTWVLVDLPLNFKPIGCKSIFRKKMKIEGTSPGLISRKASPKLKSDQEWWLDGINIITKYLNIVLVLENRIA